MPGYKVWTIWTLVLHLKLIPSHMYFRKCVVHILYVDPTWSILYFQCIWIYSILNESNRIDLSFSKPCQKEVEGTRQECFSRCARWFCVGLPTAAWAWRWETGRRGVFWFGLELWGFCVSVSDSGLVTVTDEEKRGARAWSRLAGRLGNHLHSTLLVQTVGKEERPAVTAAQHHHPSIRRAGKLTTTSALDRVLLCLFFSPCFDTSQNSIRLLISVAEDRGHKLKFGVVMEAMDRCGLRVQIRLELRDYATWVPNHVLI